MLFFHKKLTGGPGDEIWTKSVFDREISIFDDKKVVLIPPTRLWAWSKVRFSTELSLGSKGHRVGGPCLAGRGSGGAPQNKKKHRRVGDLYTSQGTHRKS